MLAKQRKGFFYFLFIYLFFDPRKQQIQIDPRKVYLPKMILARDQIRVDPHKGFSPSDLSKNANDPRKTQNTH